MQCVWTEGIVLRCRHRWVNDGSEMAVYKH